MLKVAQETIKTEKVKLGYNEVMVLERQGCTKSERFKRNSLKETLELISSCDLDAVTILILTFMQENEYHLLGTPKELLERINTTAKDA